MSYQPEWLDEKSVEYYEHHGAEVAVLNKVSLPVVDDDTLVATVNPKGEHRKLCLCYGCANFIPNDDDNCEIAQAVYDNCVKYDLVTPVLECSRFVKAPGPVD